MSDVPEVLFVGGTGRSGTHVVAKLIGRHPRFAAVPVECRFHTDERGFPGLLAGEVSKRDFLKRLRGVWWKGFQTRRMRGMFRFVPRERFDAAVAAFDARYDDAPEEACRRLFYDLLRFRAREQGARCLVEQSTDTVAAAPTLVRLFPGATFVHVVRDGRDASASRVTQSWLAYPRTRRQGLEWWEDRVRRIDAGTRAIPPDRLLTVSLDELLLLPRAGLRPLCAFLGVNSVNPMRRFFVRRMSAEEANVHRWRRGLSTRRARDIEQGYAAALERLERGGVHCAPLLRRTFERSRGADLEPLAYLSGDGTPMEAPA